MMGTFSTNVIFDEMSGRCCLGIRDISSKITFVENVPMPRQNTFSERKCRASGVSAVKTLDKTCDSLTGVFRRAGLFTCADPEIFMRGGPTKLVFFGHRRGGGSTPPPQSRNYLFLGKIFKFKGVSGPPVPPLDPRMI